MYAQIWLIYYPYSKCIHSEETSELSTYFLYSSLVWMVCLLNNLNISDWLSVFECTQRRNVVLSLSVFFHLKGKLTRFEKLREFFVLLTDWLNDWMTEWRSAIAFLELLVCRRQCQRDKVMRTSIFQLFHKLFPTNGTTRHSNNNKNKNRARPGQQSKCKEWTIFYEKHLKRCM